MSIAGNPKKLAADIRDGYLSLNQASLRRYEGPDLKIIQANLQIVLRELRAEHIDPNDAAAAKAKNMKMGRINQGLIVMLAYAKKRDIPM